MRQPSSPPSTRHGAQAANDERPSSQRAPDRPGGGTETLGWLRIEGGQIAETGEGPRQGGLDCGGLCLAPGLVDVGVKVGEPGERHKESLRTAGLAAAAGGVTSMIIRPDTLTPIDTPEVLDFVRRRARDDAAVRVHPLAALTKGREGP
jgi:dihydroorotase